MRRKKDVLPEVHAATDKPKRSRRASLMLPGRAGSSKKRARPLSDSLVSSEASSQDHAVTRPSYPRAGGSSSSMASFDFRNPFLDDGDAHQMSTSQLDLTQPLDSAAFQPPMANASIRNVARGSPIIVHPPGDHADLLCHVAEHGTLDPFTDESEPFYVGMDDGSDNFVTENVMPNKQRRRSTSLTAACRKSADFLHVRISGTAFTPPLGVGRREAWTRV
ncbi:hypothetical protein FOMPIDRAFT_1021073 [Fomitopsis schrenkii]|uniref:Uncharacterized protein n=1 Tax=Fomitopsis schrenkii TaxID=2126942 RepID=S8FXP6_FOMSC|nr:hypothetical protein FOMPIDRAFT_1021073 [Fomitopsis schrenkii]